MKEIFANSQGKFHRYIFDRFTRRLYPNILFYRRWPLFLSLSLSLTLFSRFPSHHAVITRLSVSSIIIVVKNHSKPRLTRILFSFFFFSFIFLFSFPLLQLSSQLSLLLLIVERATAAPYIFTFESIVDRFQVSDVIRFTQKIRFKLVETDKLWI